MRSIFAAVAAVALVPASASAATLVNGSFENGTLTNPSFATVAGGNSTSINGWVVTGNSVDYIGSYWSAQQGSRSIDLNGNGQGGIQQTFDTVVGQLYNISFWLAGNTDGNPTTKSVRVGAGNVSSVFTFDTTGFSAPNNMGWKNYNFQFTAGPGTSTTLSFASLDTGSFGASLDNVSVSAVPEPATWAMMMLGIGLIGGAMRRRTTAQSATRLIKA
ncbi:MULTISPECIES: choice-of-anchor C family PEP-CTERM protein [unclassified Sphingopyxis]|jgi:choice-of-anchor C domain-containing protein|uniref:choice-of-anchor C family PEP-CTERM protein n=1 Tax=unclassified Sphingopyxis TaxID=2614943 RepID=UPI0025D25BD2|nr:MULTISPECIES: choice-of-anchor C family protein [unclassified Sphingopyxis]